MNHDLTDEQIERIVKALRHYAAYQLATNRDERPYLEIAEQLGRPPGRRNEGDQRKRLWPGQCYLP